ncbi:MAG TPA: hypothetical protein VJB35_02155 [Candidatus Nanoarchaeia archaeon]|nr:hypothetical protein [Candidatus Nanoarchaeia archaeon]
MKNKTKNILIFEGIFIIGILIYLFFSTAPKQVYPLSGMTISDPDFKFEIENAKKVILSTNENLSNPIILSENTEITLPPGVYYWKVQDDLRESEIKNFTIESNVALNLREKNENYELENKGNVDLNVSKKTGSLFTSDIVINVGGSQEVEKDNSTYEGRQR